MAPIPGVGLLRNDAKIYESTDRTVPETQDLVMQTVQEQENLFAFAALTQGGPQWQP